MKPLATILFTGAEWVDIDRHAGRVIIKAPSSRQKWYMSTASVTMSMVTGLNFVVVNFDIWVQHLGQCLIMTWRADFFVVVNFDI